MRKMTISLLLFVMSMLWQCSVFKKEDKDDNTKNFALLGLLQEKVCATNQGNFIVKEGSVNCSGNVIEGSGLLLSTTEKKAPSIEIEIILNDNDSLFSFYGASDGDLKTTGSGYRFSNNSAKAFHFDGTPGGVNMTSGFSTSVGVPKKVCLEIHTGEIPPHLVAWNSSCPEAPNNSPNYDSEIDSNPGGSEAKKGEKWGLELKDAKVNLKVNEDEIFAH